jgi:hypothetical protein
MNILLDTKTASFLRTILQMGGVALVTYGVATADDLKMAMTQIDTIFGGIAAIGGLFGLGKAKGWF